MTPARDDVAVLIRCRSMIDRNGAPNGHPQLETDPRGSLAAMKNTLIAAISTFLSHYFNARFLQSGWLTDYRFHADSGSDAESTSRRVLEMKTRFLYCLREGVRALSQYDKPFDALAAFQEDRVTESFEIISTPEREFSDALLNRCTQVMASDISMVNLTDAVCGQFLRRVLRMVREELRDEERVKYLYLFCVWKMPQVLFEPQISLMITHREKRALLSNPRLPADLTAVLRDVRGGGIFGPAIGPEGRAIDEGWSLERGQAGEELAPKPRAWHRLFSRSAAQSG